MFRSLLTTRYSTIQNFINITQKRYAGHSKWQNIRHIKGEKDAQRNLLFTRLSRQIKVAVQAGGSTDPKKNLQLDQLLDNCRRANMPNATIQSVLKSCENDKTNSKPHLLEIKGPGSCIILCEIFTGHLHQTKQTVATLLRKHNAKFTDGSGQHLFDRKGIIIVEVAEGQKAEDLLEKATDDAIEVGAEEVEIVNGNLQFTCAATTVKAVASQLEKLNYNVQSASVEYTPLKLQELSDSDLQLCSNLYDKLENLPEVIRISDNIA